MSRVARMRTAGAAPPRSRASRAIQTRRRADRANGDRLRDASNDFSTLKNNTCLNKSNFKGETLEGLWAEQANLFFSRQIIVAIYIATRTAVFTLFTAIEKQ